MLTPDFVNNRRVAELFEIAPYQWERRLAREFMWYYGWDLASGVIWRPKNALVAFIGKYESAKVGAGSRLNLHERERNWRKEREKAMIIEIRAAEGGDDAKLLVADQLGIYARVAARSGL